MAVSAGATTLKAAGAVGVLLVCGVSGLAVAANGKPPAMPLRPPVDPSAPVGGSVGSTSAPDALSIPSTPVCQRPTGSGAQTGGGAPTAAPASAGTTGPSPGVDPALLPILQQLSQAPDAASRRSILMGLTADQRQQVTALLRRAANAVPARGGAAAGGFSCRQHGGGSQEGAAGSGSVGTVAPDIVDIPPSRTPLTVSAVS